MLMPPPPAAGYGTAQEPDTNARLVLIAAIAAVVLIAVGGVGIILVLVVSHSPAQRAATASANASPAATASRLVTPATPLTSETGTIVFTDDFRDPQSGWDTGSITDFSYAFANGAYVLTAKGAFIYFEPSPYTAPKQQLSVGATATLDIHTPPDAGFGVDCWRGSGAAQVTYQFYAAADSTWYVLKATGLPTETSIPTTLKQGSIKGAPAPGVIPLRLVGVCATMADGATTRLALFINGSKVADLTDTSPAFSGDAWATDLIIAGSDSGAVTVTVTHFDERDLSRGSS